MPAIVAPALPASIVYTAGNFVPPAALVAYINGHGLCPLASMVQMTQFELRKLVRSGQYIPLGSDDGPLDVATLVFLMTAKGTTGSIPRNISWSLDKFKYAINVALAVTTSLAHRRLKYFRERRSKKSVVAGMGIGYIRAEDVYTLKGPDVYKDMFGRFFKAVKTATSKQCAAACKAHLNCEFQEA
jgi:hypothetical protein